MWVTKSRALSLLPLLSVLVQAKQPNILFLFNDDQDLVLGSLNYLDSVVERIQPDAFTFNNHFATIALCCPARVALLRGQQAHNTNITNVRAPGGGYDKFRLSKQDENYLPQWLNAAGYRTEYIGKLMNQYGAFNYFFKPKGWDHFDGLLDPYTYIYNTPIFSKNGERPVLYAGQHQTDVLRAKSVDRLKYLLSMNSNSTVSDPGSSKNSTQPWFLTVAGVAPHQQFNLTGRYPPEPCNRHRGLYLNATAPRTPNFNPAVQKKPSWVGALPLMDADAIAFSDETYMRRAQALQGINEMFHELLDVLEEAGELDNTVIMFSSDHGYHIGQHRVPAGKMLPYREDTQVPFMLKGPGIPHGTTDLPSNHVDVAPTLLTLAELPDEFWPEFLDGRDLSPYWSLKNSTAGLPTAEIMNIEFWGSGMIEGQTNPDAKLLTSNSYKTIRIVGNGYGYLYSHWCTGETELYDAVTDPYELSPMDLNSTANAQLHNRLNALLLVSKSCHQETCKNPWRALHSDGSVQNLQAALDSKYDEYYTSFPKVAFQECLQYQLMKNEAPHFPEYVEYGTQYRDKAATDGFATSTDGKAIVADSGRYGDVYDPVAIAASERELTDDEIGYY